MSKYLAERVNVHTVHQTALCKVVSEAMRRKRITEPNAPQIAFEVSLKVAYLNVPSAILCRKHERTFNVAILVLKPTSQDAFCLLREVNRSVFSAFGYFGAQKDLPFRKVQIFNHKDRTFTKPHTCIYHKNDHSVISVLRKVRAIKLTDKPFEVFIRNINDLINRMYRNIGYYSENDCIVTNFDFLRKCVDNFFP